MVLWRVSSYATLDGVGGLYASGRWHTRGQPVLYCAWNPSTALLETLVHLEIDLEDRPDRFKILRIKAPDPVSLKRLSPDSLPPTWRTDLAFTQPIGDRWLHARRSLLLEVPSVLLPETFNLLVNPAHPQATQLQITKIYNYPYDSRLIR